MRIFWLCLIVSIGLHLFFFQDVLDGMLKTGDAGAVAKKPDRIKIRMVKRKKPEPPKKPKVIKPKPKVLKAAVLPKPVVKPKPKVEKPKPIIKKPRPKAKPPKPKPKPKPVANKPKPKPKPKSRSYPTRRPKLNLGKNNVPKGTKPKPKRSSNKRLTSKKRGNSKSQVATRSPKPEENGSGKAGVAPPASRPLSVPDEPMGEPYGDPNGDPVGDPNGVPDGDANGTSSGNGEVPAPPTPPKPVEQPKPPEPKPKPSPKGVATHKSMARKPIISVPNIDPPAKFRRQKLQGKLKVRFRVAPDGTFKISLSDTSGNKEFDNFVLEEIRRTASVQPGLDKEGNPKMSVVRRPVNINID